MSCAGLVEQAQTAFAESKHDCKNQGMTSDAEKELNRIERELEAKEKPPGNPWICPLKEDDLVHLLIQVTNTALVGVFNLLLGHHLQAAYILKLQ